MPFLSRPLVGLIFACSLAGCAAHTPQASEPTAAAEVTHLITQETADVHLAQQELANVSHTTLTPTTAPGQRTAHTQPLRLRPPQPHMLHHDVFPGLRR